MKVYTDSPTGTVILGFGSLTAGGPNMLGSMGPELANMRFSMISKKLLMSPSK